MPEKLKIIMQLPLNTGISNSLDHNILGLCKLTKIVIVGCQYLSPPALLQKDASLTGMEHNRLQGISGPDSAYLAVPPTSYLSTDHIVPPINGRYVDTGYLIRAISAVDGNSIQFYDNAGDAWTTAVVKDMGEFEEFNQPLTGMFA